MYRLDEEYMLSLECNPGIQVEAFALCFFLYTLIFCGQHPLLPSNSTQPIFEIYQQISHSTLPLHTQQWWVPGGRNLCLSSSSCLRTCLRVLSSPRGDDTACMVYVLYQGR